MLSPQGSLRTGVWGLALSLTLAGCTTVVPRLSCTGGARAIKLAGGSAFNIRAGTRIGQSQCGRADPLVASFS